MRSIPVLLLSTAILLSACANPDKRTLASLHDVEPDMAEIPVDDGLERAMQAYQSFLEETPESALTPEAMRRLADLKLEKEYGILGGPDAGAGSGGAAAAESGAATAAATQSAALPAPTASSVSPTDSPTERPWAAAGIPDLSESEDDFEQRAAAGDAIATGTEEEQLALPNGGTADTSGPLEAIALYDQILADYPNYQHADQVLYQKARAYDELGRNDEAIAVIALLVGRYPGSRFIDEVEFRRGEYYFMRRKYLDAEESYKTVTALGPGSEYYELALYKLGWALYKQELHEEALQQYIALLDFKVSTGYDFDQTVDEQDERRIADTYRVISLSFSSLGGPEAVEGYFAANGNRSYESRIYSHLGEFYLEKRRYHDAAQVYRTFVGLYPLHWSSPHFSMRMVEIYEAGGFPKLVLESKKEFAATYGLQSEYWHHFDVNESPEVTSYLKTNLKDLANHYHALYQNPERPEERSTNFAEALRWYRDYLASFPKDVETPAIHYQLADLLLENKDFGHAAHEYEQIAYAYPAHEKSAEAGYAAIYAHRENQKVAKNPAEEEIVKREAVESTLRFVDTFPDHEHAAKVMVAAVDDLYDMKEFARTIATGRALIERYPEADLEIRRSAWTAVAHASLDTASYPEAEDAYGRVLEMPAKDDDTRQGIVDNLAASIYKQGEQANAAGDHRAAADHFLRIARVAPTSKIRPVAEYDAGGALVKLEDWAGAAVVFEDFRKAHPEHELHREATKQMAYVYQQEGDLARSAEEYERVAAEADDIELRREAMLVAGQLYEDAELPKRALGVYLSYVEKFPEPLEIAVETRFKIAGMHDAAGDDDAYRRELKRIVAIDRSAGAARTDRIRLLAAKSALVLTEDLYERFDEVALVQPFEKNLQEKQRRMNVALDGFGRLVDYEIGEVTAAATYYVAEVYYGFSKALLESERPSDLGPAELQDYELVLEEEAFPFEERAIEVHEKNLELMTAGVYNRYTEMSFEKLAVLMPGRYAKFEESTGPLAAIDRYAYREPAALIPPEDPDGSATPNAPDFEETATEVETPPTDESTATPSDLEVAPSAPGEVEAPSETEETGETRAAQSQATGETPADNSSIDSSSTEAPPAKLRSTDVQPMEMEVQEVDEPSMDIQPSDAKPMEVQSTDEPSRDPAPASAAPPEAESGQEEVGPDSGVVAG